MILKNGMVASLDPQDVRTLASAIAVYRRHSDRLFDADVRPIGEFPDGESFTGFQAVCGADNGYLLLFRELTGCDQADFRPSGLDGRKLELELLMSNAPDRIQISPEVGADGVLHVRMDSPRSYAFLRYSVQ
jgi:hypothetical protein